MLFDNCRASVVRVACCLTMTAMVIAGIVLPCNAQERLPYVPMGISESEHEIREALQDNTNLEFVETSIGDVAAYLEDLHNIQIEIDGRALVNAGFDTDMPITCNLRAISLRSALRLILREKGLTYIVSDGVLFVTTPEVLMYRPVIEIYDISQLQPDNELQHFLTEELPEMIACVCLDESPESHCSILRNYLVVCGHAKAQGEVQRILEMLYEADHPESDGQSDVPLPGEPLHLRGLGEREEYVVPEVEPRGENPFAPFEIAPSGDRNSDDPFNNNNDDDPFRYENPF